MLKQFHKCPIGVCSPPNEFIQLMLNEMSGQSIQFCTLSLNFQKWYVLKYSCLQFIVYRVVAEFDILGLCVGSIHDGIVVLFTSKF